MLDAKLNDSNERPTRWASNARPWRRPYPLMGPGVAYAQVIERARTLWVALAGSVFLCTPSGAQNFEDQKAVMQAQIELLHKEAELQAAWRQVRGEQTWSLPHIVSISSLQGHFTARLDWGQGRQSTCAVGDKLQEDLSVEDIGPEHVRVVWQHGRLRRVTSLSFGGGPLANGLATGAISGPGPQAGSVGALAAAPQAAPGFSGWSIDTQPGLNFSPLPWPMLGALPSVKLPALKFPTNPDHSERAAAKTDAALAAGKVNPNPNPNPKQTWNAGSSATSPASPAPTLAKD